MKLLANCYRSVFSLAEENGIKTIAFPSISTGAFGYPVDQACRIALKETEESAKEHPGIGRVIFVCFDDRTFEAYLKARKERLP